ncbi:MAG: hypothetical protein KA482_01080 [Sphingobium sp.]|nr:hypothetical protein [Sphingobium sp.]MBP9156508.1 hypothetical protein [Sphingobium sp.]
MSRKDDDKLAPTAAPDMSGAAKAPRAKKPAQRRAKPNSSRYRANDEGGYGNPPVKNQFKPGNKGGGRKKGNVTLESELRRVFRDRVPLADGSKTPMVRALAELTKKQLLTNPKALPWAFELAEKYGPKEAEHRVKINMEILTDAELNIYGVILDRLIASFQDEDKTDEKCQDIQERLGLYRVSMREDGLPGIDQLKDDEPRNTNGTLLLPRDDYYLDREPDGTLWRRSKRSEIPDILIGFRDPRSRLSPDDPYYLNDNGWQIDPEAIRFVKPS